MVSLLISAHCSSDCHEITLCKSVTHTHTHTHLPMLGSSTACYQLKGADALRLGRYRRSGITLVPHPSLTDIPACWLRKETRILCVLNRIVRAVCVSLKFFVLLLSGMRDLERDGKRRAVL